MGKDLEDGYRIGHFFKQGIDLVVLAELCPAGPLIVGSLGSCQNNASFDGCLHSSQITLEISLGVGVHNCQELVCG